MYVYLLVAIYFINVFASIWETNVLPYITEMFND